MLLVAKYHYPIYLDALRSNKQNFISISYCPAGFNVIKMAFSECTRQSLVNDILSLHVGIDHMIGNKLPGITTRQRHDIPNNWYCIPGMYLLQ